MAVALIQNPRRLTRWQHSKQTDSIQPRAPSNLLSHKPKPLKICKSITPISLAHPRPNMAFVRSKSLTLLKSGNLLLSFVGRHGCPRHCVRDAIIIWSMLSLAALLGGIGLLFAAFGRWNFMGWHGREQQTLSFRAPGEVALTPGQRACAGFFAVMAVLFLIQTLVGGASEHYRAELSNFFGIDLAVIFPFNLMRTWHIQLAIFWVATSFLAAGIFLAPMIAGREPKHQAWLAYGLLGALALVVFGSMAGEYISIHGGLKNWWMWFGMQGFEYLDLGRFWQILLTIGLFFWVILLFRGLRAPLATDNKGNMPWLFFFSALSIPAFYAVGLLARPTSHFTTTEFWRFWVVHLWVEDFLELFTTIMVAYIFVLLGVVHERVALTLIYLDIVLYSAGGVIGTMHHVYFSG